MTSKRGTKLVVFKGYIEEMPITDYQYVVERKSDIVLDNEQLNFIRGQRGNYLTTYWCCRCRQVGKAACRARITTIQKMNGLHKIIVTKPFHNHAPSPRMLKRFKKFDIVQ
ncbi:uncharacterized protein LOC119650912 isoform X1 [Hermetia illucens]|uniref:uncharacterized protein LOC119650912 isoform X1 n=1 Tax=Hermetia illucens TaxID=343691 RepID=UPI0018CC4733|nr:uncharacterized protein LOC119650912 isoform X1 [Hermetia illucens]XP_037910063.1 uncharacterized protein LOC119650912 isoform X1 [Hermetia illucens]